MPCQASKKSAVEVKVHDRFKAGVSLFTAVASGHAHSSTHQMRHSGGRGLGTRLVPNRNQFEMVRPYYSAMRAHNFLGHAHLPSPSPATRYPSSRVLLLSNCFLGRFEPLSLSLNDSVKQLRLRITVCALHSLRRCNGTHICARSTVL